MAATTAQKGETTIEAIRALIAKIPNLKHLIEEAEKPKETVVAETAYIYNGYGVDVVLMHVGIEYPCKAYEITTIYGMPDYKEIDPQRSRPDAIEWFHLPMKGEFIAHELVNKQDFDKRGMAVFTTMEWDEDAQADVVPRHVKDAADERGHRYWTSRIEEFKVNRKKAESGIAGYKINPDENLYTKMKELSPDDVHFAQGSQKRIDQLIAGSIEDRGQLADAIRMLAEIARGNRAEPVMLNLNTIVEEPRIPSISERAKVVACTRRPHESDTVFEARIMALEQMKARTEAAELQARKDAETAAAVAAGDDETDE